MTGIWTIVLLGAIAGLAAAAAWRLAFPPPLPLSVALERLRQTTAPDEAELEGVDRWHPQLGQRARPTLESLGISLGDLAADARITGTSLDAHLGSKITSAALPIVFTAALALLLEVGGVNPPIGILVGVGVLGAAIGFWAPDWTLRKNATERRREFSLAFGSYLDLVAISLAGGMGTEAALVEAARIGDSWAFRMLRRAIEVAQIEGTTLWAALTRLGDELGIAALGELAGSVALAGNEGAKVRNSIAVKADTLRALELAQAETEAQTATERMAVPTAMLLFGFILLIGFPAVLTVINGL
jgi:tight adherence protein C